MEIAVPEMTKGGHQDILALADVMDAQKHLDHLTYRNGHVFDEEIFVQAG